MKKLALSMDEETIAQAERMAAEQGRPEGLVSAISFADVFYMMRRWADADTARQAVVLV